MLPTNVIYWPSTEPSVKRCTCVNKQKNSRSRWTLENNISWCPGGSNSVETGMPNCEPTCGLWLLGPQGPRVEQPQPRCERSAAMVQRRTWVNIAVCPCLHSSLTYIRTSTLSKIEWKRFIFLSRRVFVRLLKLSLSVDYVSAYICANGYTTQTCRLQIIFIWYVYNEDLALNNLEGVMRHKTQLNPPNKTTKFFLNLITEK